MPTPLAQPLLWLALASGGSLLPPGPVAPVPVSAPVSVPASLAPATGLPATKSVTVLVEGEPRTIPMQLYQHPSVPLVTYYPSTMVADQACDTDGCGVWFTHRATGASLIFILPAEADDATDVTPYITGPKGLATANQWVITGTDTDALEFPWAQEQITFHTPDQVAVGLVYLGEVEDQGFAAIALFPPEAGDSFMPQAQAILAEVQVGPGAAEE